MSADRYDSYDASLDRDLDAEVESAAVEALSPELREAMEAAKARCEAAGWAMPEEAEPEPESADVGEEAAGPTVVGGVALCVYCGAEIPSPLHAYRRVVAWERKRRQGGTNAVRLREQLDEYACARCVDAVAAGRDPGQAAIL